MPVAWQVAIWLALTMMASQKKKQSYEQGLSTQRAIRSDNEAKRLALEKKNDAKRKELLRTLDKGNVTKDSVVQSQRIKGLMDKISAPRQDKMVSKGSPQIVKDAMGRAMGDVGTNVAQRGAAKAKLESLTNQFGKYQPELTDAQTLAQNIASKLKGNEAVMNIGMSEAANTYDQQADIMSQLAQLYGMYAMGQSGKDPKIIS